MLDTGYEVLLLFITILTLFLQVYVLFLIRFISPKNMKDYRYFLNVLMGWDIVFNLCLGLIVQPYPLSPTLSVSTRGFCSIFGQFACYVSLGAALYCGAAVIIVQIYCLIYRFLIILATKRVMNIFMSTPIIISLWMLAQSICIATGFFLYKVLLRPEELSTFTLFDKSIIGVPLLPDEIIIAIDLRLPISQLFLLTIVILLAIAEIFSILMIYGILSYLQKHSGMFSKSTYKMHLQLTALLGIQLFSPMILLVIPSIIYVYALVQDISSNQTILEIGFTFIMMYGAFNAFFTLIFVSAYRSFTYKKLIEPILKPLCLINKVSTNFVSSQSQTERISGRNVTV